MTQKARRLTRISFLGAMGTILMLSIQIPFPWAPFLKYDPGNIPALMATFLFGPLEGMICRN
ncbi:MAG: hypothetical protein HYU64_06270 [Armatimonadetes bacterium]|nr:hypothetical protein [Armatimonadota bacterium]